MMRPGAGQNYPRSGFPLEGKAATGLLPFGKARIAPYREAGTKQPPPRPAESRRGGGSPGQPPAVRAAVPRRGWWRALSRDGQGWGRRGEGPAAGRRLRFSHPGSGPSPPAGGSGGNRARGRRRSGPRIRSLAERRAVIWGAQS